MVETVLKLSSKLHRHRTNYCRCFTLRSICCSICLLLCSARTKPLNVLGLLIRMIRQCVISFGQFLYCLLTCDVLSFSIAHLYIQRRQPFWYLENYSLIHLYPNYSIWTISQGISRIGIIQLLSNRLSALR